MSSTDGDDDERVLRDTRPTGSNKQVVLELMERTRASRRHWIESVKPDATTILRRYPRFMDVTETVDEEFASVVSCDWHLRDKWRPLRDKVLSYAVSVASKDSDLKALLSTLDEDEFDEGKKTDVSIKVLPYLLVPPPKRGLKTPRIGRTAVLQMLVVDIEENMSVEEAVQKVSAFSKQPLLFFLQGLYYVKVDSYAIAATDVSCCCDAIEFLMKIYYTCNLDYEHELKPVFGLLEKAWGIPVSIGRSSALSDFVRQGLENCL